MALYRRPQFWLDTHTLSNGHGHAYQEYPHFSHQQPVRLFDQHFGSGLFEDDFLAPLEMLGARPRHFRNRESGGLSEIKCDNNSFQVLVQFRYKPFYCSNLTTFL